MPLLAVTSSSRSGFSPTAASAAWSPAISGLKAGLRCHSGCWAAFVLTWSIMNRNWKYSGCSLHKVPSLSKVAMRSAGGTYEGPPSRVTSPTNFTIAVFAGPSFHEGNGSPPILPAPAQPTSVNAAAAAHSAPKARRVSLRQGPGNSASIRSSIHCVGLSVLPARLVHHQPEAEVRHAGVGIGAAPRARPVAHAIGLVAQEGAAARHTLGRADGHAGFARIPAVGRALRIDLRFSALRNTRE